MTFEAIIFDTERADEKPDKGGYKYKRKLNRMIYPLLSDLQSEFIRVNNII